MLSVHIGASLDAVFKIKLPVKKELAYNLNPVLAILTLIKLMIMSPDTKMTCGIILLTIPTIQYGGYFLLSILSGRLKLPLTEFQKSMFRAGHAHAGVLVILALIAQVLADYASLNIALEKFVRIGFPLAAILVSGGFFASASGKNITKPNNLISILYAGILILAASTIILGIGLIRNI